jgi:hypothetical protein
LLDIIDQAYPEVNTLFKTNALLTFTVEQVEEFETVVIDK